LFLQFIVFWIPTDLISVEQILFQFLARLVKHEIRTTRIRRLLLF